jgi:hypothetical protein
VLFALICSRERFCSKAVARILFGRPFLGSAMDAGLSPALSGMGFADSRQCAPPRISVSTPHADLGWCGTHATLSGAFAPEVLHVSCAIQASVVESHGNAQWGPLSTVRLLCLWCARWGGSFRRHRFVFRRRAPHRRGLRGGRRRSRFWLRWLAPRRRRWCCRWCCRWRRGRRWMPVRWDARGCGHGFRRRR